MKILGYMQLRNEDRFALAAAESILSSVDNLIVVFDRCIDDTINAFKSLPSSYKGFETTSEKELLELRGGLFQEFKQFQWLWMLNGDEVYSKSIRNLHDFLSKRPLEDVSSILGHTIHILNEDATLYTDLRIARSRALSTTKLYNLKAFTSVESFTPWTLDNIKYTYGSPIVFDTRQNYPPEEGLTSYHMHFLKRSSIEFKRPMSPFEFYYTKFTHEHTTSLELPFLERSKF